MRVLITGGSQGIGAAIVAHATKAGHQVAFTGRQQAAIDEVAKKEGAHGIKADVSSDADNARVAEACLQQMGGIDVLINNAGVGYFAEIGAIDMHRMRSLFGTNVFGMVDLTNRVAPLMKAQGSGDIINIASTSGTKGAKGCHGLCRQQVGGARHYAVLAGRAAPVRDPRRVHPAVGSPDQLDGPDRTQQSEQALREGHCRDDLRGTRHAAQRAVAGGAGVRE